jgi:restriction endonuclease S subunit
MNDILVRLSTPYTTIMITNETLCGYLVPSHFAIIRVNENKASPEYVLWLLKREATKQKILQNISGSGAFGTINSKFFSTLSIRSLPLKKQKTIGQMQILSEKEQELLHKLTVQKEIYNKLLIDKIYDSVKRGN